MKLDKSLKIALNIIFHSKLRSWLTIIGIVIGVTAIIAIVSIGSGFQKDVQAQLGGLGSDTITVTPGFDKAETCPGPKCRGRPGATLSVSTKPLTNKELQSIKGVPDILLVNAIVSGSSSVYYIGDSASLTVDGVDVSTWKFMTTSSLDSGRFIGPGDTNSIVIGGSIAKEVFKNKVGINRPLTINGKPFRVVGILKTGGGFGADDRKIFMPLSSAKEILGKADNSFDSITVKVKDQNNIDAVTSAIEKKLMTVRHVNADTKDFTVISMKAIQEKVTAVLAGFTLFIAVIAAVSLLVGAVGIMNTMFTSVLEKTKDIGIMKALGAKNSDILIIFLFNSGFVGLVGGLIGVLFGILIAISIPALGVSLVPGGQGITTSIPVSFVIFTLVFSVALGMVSGIIPAYRASKLNPVEALRSE